MSTVFVGGSRHVSRFPVDVRKRLDNIMASGFRVIVGDANGADKSAQKHLLDAGYENVTVFCSGLKSRNNLRPWAEHRVEAPKSAKGFQFYAAKDREMAREADFGLMIWDGKSPGTVLNVMRLVQAGKKAVLINGPAKDSRTFKTDEDWQNFLGQCPPELLKDLKDRATPEEWTGENVPTQANFLEAPELEPPLATIHEQTKDLVALEAKMNRALADGDPARVMEAIGAIARGRGMSRVSRESGLARESLYRSLRPGGNPEFATVLKVMASLGISLTASRNSHTDAPL